MNSEITRISEIDTNPFVRIQAASEQLATAESIKTDLQKTASQPVFIRERVWQRIITEGNCVRGGLEMRIMSQESFHLGLPQNPFMTIGVNEVLHRGANIGLHLGRMVTVFPDSRGVRWPSDTKIVLKPTTVSATQVDNFEIPKKDVIFNGFAGHTIEVAIGKDEINRSLEVLSEHRNGSAILADFDVMRKALGLKIGLTRDLNTQLRAELRRREEEVIETLISGTNKPLRLAIEKAINMGMHTKSRVIKKRPTPWEVRTIGLKTLVLTRAEEEGIYISRQF